MGGTSFDVGVIRDGVPAVSADKEMGYGLPVRVPMIDIHTIGAGGGSIARVNSAGILQVGPGERGRRARADLLRPRRRRAHHHRREPPARAPESRRAARRRGRRRSSIACARSSTRRSAPTSASARTRSPPPSCAWPTTRWRAPSAWSRCSAATIRATSSSSRSAAPVRSTPSALARELAIPKVLVPARPGITSALGCLVADVRHDFVRTINQDVLRMDVDEARAILAAQVEEGRRLLASEGVEVETVSVLHQADMQFVGQTHVLTVTIPRDGLHARRPAARASSARTGSASRWSCKQMRALVMSLRTAVIGRRRPVSLPDAAASARGTPGRTRGAGRRPVLVRRGVARHADLSARAARRPASGSTGPPSWSSSTPPP